MIILSVYLEARFLTVKLLVIWESLLIISLHVTKLSQLTDFIFRNFNEIFVKLLGQDLEVVCIPFTQWYFPFTLMRNTFAENVQKHFTIVFVVLDYLISVKLTDLNYLVLKLWKKKRNQN